MPKYDPIGLTPEQTERKRVLVAQLRRHRQGVDAALRILESALEPYNRTLDAVRAFAVEVEEAAECAIQQRSDSWQDTARGEAANDYRCAWGYVHHSQQFCVVVVSIPDHADIFTNLKECP